jgi:hypothetical protein
MEIQHINAQIQNRQLRSGAQWEARHGVRFIDQDFVDETDSEFENDLEEDDDDLDEENEVDHEEWEDAEEEVKDNIVNVKGRF